MISTSNYNYKKIRIGGVREKKPRDGKSYLQIPIFYGEEKARVHLCGRFQIRSDYLSLQVDDDNRKLFEDFENQLMYFLENDEVWTTVIEKEDVKLIRGGRVYLKIYQNDGKMTPKFWKLFEKDGKEYKKPIHNPESLIGENIEGEVVFSIANIFVGKTKKGESFPQSIVSVAEEIIVREIIGEKSYFEEYPVYEESD